MSRARNIARIGFTVGAFALLSPTTTASAVFTPTPGQFNVGATWEQYSPIGDPQTVNSWSSLAKSPSLGNSSSSTDTVCTSLTDPKCVTYGREVTPAKIGTWSSNGSFGYAWIAVFPQCTTAEELNCISGLTAIRNDQALITKYARNFPRGTPFTGDPTLKIPNGGYAPVYAVDGLPKTSNPLQTETKELVVRVVAYGQNRLASCAASIDAKSTWCQNVGRALTTDGFDWPQWRLEGFRVDVMQPRVSYSAPGRIPATTEYGDVNIDKDVRFTVTTRIAEYVMPRGWMHGRLDSPTLSQTPINGGYELAVGGKATQVPNPSGTLTCADYPRLNTPETAVVRESFDQNWNDRTRDAGLPASSVCDPAAVQRLIGAATPGRIFTASAHLFNALARRATLTARKDEDLQRQVAWLIALGDKANSISSEWMLEWVPPDNPQEPWSTSLCINNGLAGIVTTNATMYGELPIFDPQIGALEYAMAGPHYLTDGVTLNKGTYSLIAARDYVMCEWGVDPANTTMAVSVRYDTGLQQEPPVLTTAYDGQYYSLTASGFTFSAPKINVKPKEKKITTKRTVRAGAGSNVNISKVVPRKKKHTASWYVLKGNCKITKERPNVLTMPKTGSCQLAVTQFNLKTKRSMRTLVTLQT